MNQRKCVSLMVHPFIQFAKDVINQLCRIPKEIGFLTIVKRTLDNIHMTGIVVIGI